AFARPAALPTPALVLRLAGVTVLLIGCLVCFGCLVLSVRFVHFGSFPGYSKRDLAPGRRSSPARPLGEDAGPMMRVLIVDDHPVTRDGLRSALSTSNDVEIVGEASTGEAAVDAVTDVSPDMVF